MVSSPSKLPSSFMDCPKALGLSPQSEQLFDILPNIATNMAGIKTNADDIQALETMGSGSVWFDAWRYVHFDKTTSESLSI